MNKYEKTIMYKLVNYDCPELLYVGSTINFIKRKSTHKACSKTSNAKIYRTIRENGGWESWVMVKISDFPCKSNTEARMEEDRLMIEMKSNLNMVKAYTSPEQRIEQKRDSYKKFCENNKEYMKEYDKQYYQSNKEHIKEQKKQYSSKKTTCECGCSIANGTVARHKKTIKHQKLLALASPPQ